MDSWHRQAEAESVLRSVATFQQYLTPLAQGMRDPKSLSRFSPSALFEQIQGTSRQQAIVYSVIGAEILGFFTVGTMIGKMKIVGYRGEKPAEHH